MGTLHAWETYDGVAPDIQAIAKGLGGGYVDVKRSLRHFIDDRIQLCFYRCGPYVGEDRKWHS